jgi:hypothetical protein
MHCCWCCNTTAACKPRKSSLLADRCAQALILLPLLLLLVLLQLHSLLKNFFKRTVQSPLCMQQLAHRRQLS